MRHSIAFVVVILAGVSRANSGRLPWHSRQNENYHSYDSFGSPYGNTESPLSSRQLGSQSQHQPLYATSDDSEPIRYSPTYFQASAGTGSGERAAAADPSSSAWYQDQAGASSYPEDVAISQPQYEERAAYEESGSSQQEQLHSPYYSGLHPKDVREFDKAVPAVEGDLQKQRLEFQVHGLQGPNSYRFGYDTGKGYNRQFRYEERDNYGNVKGRYGFYDMNGELQIVNYSATPKGGFHAEGDFGKYPNKRS